MSRVGGKNTTPEIAVRKAAHSLGLSRILTWSSRLPDLPLIEISIVVDPNGGDEIRDRRSHGCGLQPPSFDVSFRDWIAAVRVVIWKDKSRLTGWGEATVPNYHGQFIAITGIVLLRCDDPKKLPLTTTKRGIDAASNVYSEAKDLMRDATKILTSFTNKWKKFPQKLEEIYQATEYVDLTTLRALPSKLTMTSSRKMDGIKKYEPKYPEPEQEKTSTRVSFVALKADVRSLAEHFFDDVKVKPGAVGEASFNQALKSIKASKK